MHIISERNTKWKFNENVLISIYWYPPSVKALRALSIWYSAFIRFAQHGVTAGTTNEKYSNQSQSNKA